MLYSDDKPLTQQEYEEQHLRPKEDAFWTKLGRTPAQPGHRRLPPPASTGRQYSRRDMERPGLLGRPEGRSRPAASSPPRPTPPSQRVQAGTGRPGRTDHCRRSAGRTGRKAAGRASPTSQTTTARWEPTETSPPTTGATTRSRPRNRRPPTRPRQGAPYPHQPPSLPGRHCPRPYQPGHPYHHRSARKTCGRRSRSQHSERNTDQHRIPQSTKPGTRHARTARQCPLPGATENSWETAPRSSQPNPPWTLGTSSIGTETSI